MIMVQGLRIGSKCWTQSYIHLWVWKAAREAFTQVQRLVPSYSSVSCKKSSYMRTVVILYTLCYTTSMHTKNFKIHLWETPCPFYTYLYRCLHQPKMPNICTSTCTKGMVSPTDEFSSSWCAVMLCNKAGMISPLCAYMKIFYSRHWNSLEPTVTPSSTLLLQLSIPTDVCKIASSTCYRSSNPAP